LKEGHTTAGQWRIRAGGRVTTTSAACSAHRSRTQCGSTVEGEGLRTGVARLVHGGSVQLPAGEELCRTARPRLSSECSARGKRPPTPRKPCSLQVQQCCAASQIGGLPTGPASVQLWLGRQLLCQSIQRAFLSLKLCPQPCSPNPSGTLRKGERCGRRCAACIPRGCCWHTMRASSHPPPTQPELRGRRGMALDTHTFGVEAADVEDVMRDRLQELAQHVRAAHRQRRRVNPLGAHRVGAPRRLHARLTAGSASRTKEPHTHLVGKWRSARCSPVAEGWPHGRRRVGKALRGL
jgi:hypothetical protein